MSQINFIFNKGLTNLFSSTSFSSTYDNSKNITDSSLNTYATTNNSTNEYIDVSLNSLVDLSNIQSIKDELFEIEDVEVLIEESFTWNQSSSQSFYRQN